MVWVRPECADNPAHMAGGQGPEHRLVAPELRGYLRCCQDLAPAFDLARRATGVFIVSRQEGTALASSCTPGGAGSCRPRYVAAGPSCPMGVPIESLLAVGDVYARRMAHTALVMFAIVRGGSSSQSSA